MRPVDRDTAGPRSSGRGPNARSHEAILAATDELLAGVGYAALTIEGVAARAGVGKTTVYRWWPSKAALVIETVSQKAAAPPVHDTGSLRGDLIAAVDHAVAVLSSSTAASAIPAMTADLIRDPAMAEQFRDKVLRPRRSAVAGMVDRAIARGELPPDVDVHLVLDLCIGAAFYRLVVSGEPMTDAFAERVVDLVLTGALPREARSRRSSRR
jgi:AcrR family transcriptional regulator